MDQKILDRLQGKVVVVTGGTGSFGVTFVKFLMNTQVACVRVFSRDEKKQDEMRRATWIDARVEFFIGDVRDRNSLVSVLQDANYVFHAAALKQVPSCEFFPMEAVKTNIIGTHNVISACIECGVESLVCLSTDKAVYPINTMGITKACMERIAISEARIMAKTESVKLKISITRYGNVLGSRGSVVPKFFEQVRSGHPLTITNPKMTRFLMPISEAIELVIFALLSGSNGSVFVRKAKATSIQHLAKSVLILTGQPADYEIQYLGARHGEKLSESLLSEEERERAIDRGEYLEIKMDERDLNYKAFEEGDDDRSENKPDAFISDIVHQLSLEETTLLLQSELDEGGHA